MSFDQPKCKITVLKKMLNQDLVEAYLDTEEEMVACEVFGVGQVFMVDEAFQMPEDFCPWAWADIRHDLMTVFVGGDPPWMKQRGTVITGCTDWFRPVIFEVKQLA